MKVIVERQFNKCGNEFLENDEIEIEIKKIGKNIIIETFKEMFSIPIEVFKGILERQK